MLANKPTSPLVAVGISDPHTVMIVRFLAASIELLRAGGCVTSRKPWVALSVPLFFLRSVRYTVCNNANLVTL